MDSMLEMHEAEHPGLRTDQSGREGEGREERADWRGCSGQIAGCDVHSKVPAGLVCGEGLLPLQKAAFSLCILTRNREKGSSVSWSLPYEDTYPPWRVPPSRPVIA